MLSISVKKGTKSVVGYMKIEQIITTNNKYGILTDWSKDIAVSPGWIADYVKNANNLYGFFISGYKFF